MRCVLVVLLAGLLASCIGGSALDKPLIDLKLAPLREAFDQGDVEWISKNARLKAYYCAQKKSGWPDMRWSRTVSVVWQRELGPEDYHGVVAHPRDRDLTGDAYKQLAATVLEAVESGRTSCEVERTHPDILVLVQAMAKERE